MKNFSWLCARLQRVVGAFLMLPVGLPVVEHWRRRDLSRRNLAQRFLISLEQCINHRGHLPGYSPEHLFLSPIISGSLVIGAETREQALIDSCPLTIKGRCSGRHKEKNLFHGTDPSRWEICSIHGNPGLLFPRRPTKVDFALALFMKIG